MKLLWILYYFLLFYIIMILKGCESHCCKNNNKVTFGDESTAGWSNRHWFRSASSCFSCFLPFVYFDFLGIYIFYHWQLHVHYLVGLRFSTKFAYEGSTLDLALQSYERLCDEYMLLLFFVYFLGVVHKCLWIREFPCQFRLLAKKPAKCQTNNARTLRLILIRCPSFAWRLARMCWICKDLQITSNLRFIPKISRRNSDLVNYIQSRNLIMINI